MLENIRILKQRETIENDKVQKLIISKDIKMLEYINFTILMISDEPLKHVVSNFVT
jgi:translation initiation factor RLI1